MKKLLVLLATAVLAVGTVAAQVPSGVNTSPRPTVGSTPATAGANSETKVFAIEFGTGFAYDLSDKSSGATQSVTAVFGLTDSVQAGFSVIKGDNTTTHQYNLIKVAVYPISDLAVVLDLGANGSAKVVSGFGVAYNVFRNTTGGLTTALQGNISYLATDISTGSVALGLNLKIGL